MDLTGDRSCGPVRERLPLVVGGDLPESAAPAVLDHLRRCRACQRAMSGYLASRAALREAALPPAVDEGFFRGLAADIVRSTAVLPRPAPGRRRLAVRVAVAAACLVLGLAVAWILAGVGAAPGSGLLQQPPLAVSPPVGAGVGERIVPVSFWPSAQGLGGLQKLGRDPRWTDAPREPR
jgi:hypothetical protein